MSPRLWFVLILSSLFAAGCRPESSESDTREAEPGERANAWAPAAAPRVERAPRPDRTTERRGSALARTPDQRALVLADEDHRALRVIPLPVDVQRPPVALPLPGAPAQVVALPDRVLVTIREPGLLLELVWQDDRLVESGRAELPWDAWGLSVSPDGRTAVVTSAWTHQISGVDLASLRVRWSINAAREPRGVAIASDQTAYVSHLVGNAVTRVRGVDSGAPEAERFTVAPAPARARRDQLLDASLGYAALLSPEEDRLLLPRHALGAQGDDWWFGQGAVDVVSLPDFTHQAPSPSSGSWADWSSGALMDDGALVAIEPTPFVQPRDAVYRASTRTLLVASEGDNRLVELDARAMDPGLARVRAFELGRKEGREPPWPDLVTSGGAPSAVALSTDEQTAWVFCRSTYDLAIVSLEGEPSPIPWIHLADDPLGEDAARGRRLFYDATDTTVSGGLGCAGCHPEGRDDGHVWHELVDEDTADAFRGYRGATIVSTGLAGAQPTAIAGFARQTPMLAGRLALQGPYGWRGEAPSLEARLREGFSLHRWGGQRENPYQVTMERPALLAAFVREGLVAPSLPERALTELEQRGRTIFEDAATGCTTCHDPRTQFANGATALLDRPQHPGFEPEPGVAFKTPSLLFVGGTPPYFHDGQAATLEDLVRKNGTSMGDTSRLREDDQRALAAYLRTIGGYVPPEPEGAPHPAVSAPPHTSPKRPKPPARALWNAAPEIPVKGTPCTIKRLGEFLQVGCPAAIAASGSNLGGTELWTTSANDGGFSRPPARFVFPLREGDRWLVQMSETESVGRWGTRTRSAGVLQATWDPGQAAPTLIVSR